MNDDAVFKVMAAGIASVVIAVLGWQFTETTKLGSRLTSLEGSGVDSERRIELLQAKMFELHPMQRSKFADFWGDD